MFINDILHFKMFYYHGVIHRDIEPAIYISPRNIDDDEYKYQFGYLIWCQNGLINRTDGNLAIEILNTNDDMSETYKFGTISTSIIQSVDGTLKNVLGHSIIFHTIGVEFIVNNNTIIEIGYNSQRHFLELSLEAIDEDNWCHPLMNELIEILKSLNIV